MAGIWNKVIELSEPIIGQPTTADIWNRLLELSLPIIGQPTVDALHKNSDVSRNISRLRATLPRAQLLIERSESWGFFPIDGLLPQLKEAVNKANHELDQFDSQKQRLEGPNWNIQGQLVNNFKNWISGFPDKVKSANDALDHVCNEMANICTMLDIPNSPNQFSEHISRLHAILPRARLLVERSECWRFRFNPIKELLPQLKEAVYKSEIELDHIKSKKRMLEGANWRIEGDLLDYFRNWISGFPDKVKNTRETLEYVCNEMEKLCENYKIPENPNKFSNNARPITSSSHPKVYGRDKELDEAIHSLGVPKSARSSRTKRKKNEKIVILPIVGMGGVGKTTLAQMVYRDKRVQSYFDSTIWICVSDKFDKKRLTKEILESVTGKVCNITNLNKIEEELEEILNSKRVLLVLDDIWSKDWHGILGRLNETSEGSAVILTMRSPEHLQCTGGNMTILKSILLEGLEKKIYWDFFKTCAGLEGTGNNYGELEGIAIEICNRLKGIPLAAITLGGILSKRIDRNQWINIRDSKMWELKQEEEYDIMPVLRLSYQYLPSDLKKCFSFCSLYPKDHEFTAVGLAKFWIMEGLIPIQEHLKQMEDLALYYFGELKNSRFFHLKEGSCETYVIHDLMHDVCQSITTEECYCLQDGEICFNKDNIHHLSIFKKPNPENTRETLTFKNAQSLLVASQDYSFRAIKSWCNGLTLRRLSLPSCKIKNLPKSIGNLKQLKYLDISNTPIEKLPDSFWTLYNLHHLDMSSCDMLYSDSPGLPNSSNNLIGLQFFRPPLHLVHFLTDKPNLVRAMQFYDLVYDVGKHGGKRIENLKHLIGVRGFLEIRLEDIFTKEAAQEAELNKQQFVRTLCLFWQRSIEIKREVLEGLCPHRNLEVLNISQYGGSTLAASWMGDNLLPNLRKVSLRNCSSCSVTQLPRSITELTIQECHNLTSLTDCLRPNLLPKLKFLILSMCYRLKSLPVESFSRFESLEKLCIVDCPELICPKTMVLPPSIKVLELSSCGQLKNSIPSCLENLSSLEKLRIKGFPELTCPTKMVLPSSIKVLELICCGELENSISSYLENLSSLEELWIFNCPSIVSIPNEVMRNLKFLKRLFVTDCPNLISLGDEEFLKSIKNCDISNCPNRKITWGRNPDGRKLSDLPSSSNARKRKIRK